MPERQRRIEELLSGLLDDELSGEERREALSLVKRDPEARELFERMRATAEAMRAEQAPAPPQDLAAKIGESVRKSGGDLIETRPMRWLGPAALTAAASVAAALLIGALLHDHWEVFAPKLSYEEAPIEEPSKARPSLATPEDVEPAPEKEEPGRQKNEASPAEAREQGVALDAVEADASAPERAGSAQPKAPASRAEVPESTTRAFAESDLTEEAATVTIGEALAPEEERIASESRMRSRDEARSSKKAAALACSSPWSSSTSVRRAEDAPENADDLLRALIISLGGRLERDPDATLVLPAKSVPRFIDALPGTGHVFVGPAPVLPGDRDCLRLRLM